MSEYLVCGVRDDIRVDLVLAHAATDPTLLDGEARRDVSLVPTGQKYTNVIRWRKACNLSNEAENRITGGTVLNLIQTIEDQERLLESAF